MIRTIVALAFALAFALVLPAHSSLAKDAVEDGVYDAEVTTSSGTYTVPVEVEDGEVTHVDWPNGGRMGVDGAALDSGTAFGFNSRGESVGIQINDANYNNEPDDE